MNGNIWSPLIGSMLADTFSQKKTRLFCIICGMSPRNETNGKKPGKEMRRRYKNPEKGHFLVQNDFDSM